MSDKHVRGTPHPVMHREAPAPDIDEDETQFLAVRFMPTEPLPSETTDEQREVAAAVHKLTHAVERESRFQRVLDDVRWGQYVAGAEGRTTKFRPPPELLYASVPPMDASLGALPPGSHLEPTALPPSPPPPLRRSVPPPLGRHPSRSDRPGDRPSVNPDRPALRRPVGTAPKPPEPASRAYFWIALILVGITAALLSPLGTGRPSASRAHRPSPTASPTVSPTGATPSTGVARQ